MKHFDLVDHLIVAADFEPEPPQGRQWVEDKVLELAEELRNTGVYLKMNSALQACGYRLSDKVRQCGLRVFGDWKFNDIPNTLKISGMLAAEAKLDLVTVMCNAGDASLRALKSTLPFIEVLGVTILTSMNEEEVARTYRSPNLLSTVGHFAAKARDAGLDGIICAGTDTIYVRQIVGSEMTINTPGIRPSWSIVAGDDQNPERIVTPAKAITYGANRIVVGRPILQAKNRRDAVMRTLDEIVAATPTPSE